MIVNRDVWAWSKWFQDVLGLSSGHSGGEYEMLMDGDTMVAQLHRWDAHEHPPRRRLEPVAGKRHAAVVRH